MTMSPNIRLYHTGVIVDDLEAAMHLWGSALGLHWAPPLTSSVPLLCPTGVEPREVVFTYSLEGPHHIELLEQVNPAPYLNLTGGRHIHHLGYFTTDLPGESARLEGLGLRRELSGVAKDGAVARATFHIHPVSPGMWIELVDQSVAEFTDPWLSEAAAKAGVDYVSPFSMACRPEPGLSRERAQGRRAARYQA
jgi:hypothetical protein